MRSHLEQHNLPVFPRLRETDNLKLTILKTIFIIIIATTDSIDTILCFRKQLIGNLDSREFEYRFKKIWNTFVSPSSVQEFHGWHESDALHTMHAQTTTPKMAENCLCILCLWNGDDVMGGGETLVSKNFLLLSCTVSNFYLIPCLVWKPWDGRKKSLIIKVWCHYSQRKVFFGNPRLLLLSHGSRMMKGITKGSEKVGDRSSNISLLQLPLICNFLAFHKCKLHNRIFTYIS